MFENKDNRKIKIIDPSTAVSNVAYAFVDMCIVYPITPSTEMSECVEKLYINKVKNIFDQVPLFFETHSESGTAGVIHGASSSGALCTTFTCSQGLLLMIPVLYKLAGEFLPVVIHVASRSLARHALSIFAEHSDIYACRQTGVMILCSSSAQEANDLAAIAHMVSIYGITVIHFFDGFRTSHEICKIKTWDYEDLKKLFDFCALQKFRNSSLNPYRSFVKGTNQNEDIYFQCLEASNKRYEEIIKLTSIQMDKINNMIGTDYKAFNYYGSNEAKIVIVAMGSVCGTIEDTIDYLNKEEIHLGLIKVRLYRPFSNELFINELPKSIEKICIIDRAKEPGSSGEPMYLDVISAIDQKNLKNIKIFRGRYGISSKNIDQNDILSIYYNMISKNHKKHFTVGINDDVTNLSLKINDEKNIENNLMNIEVWGLGSDGAVSASKSTIKIIGENTDLFVQGYFKYDSKKSGGLTISYLKINGKPIRSSCYIKEVDFLICQHFDFINIYEFDEKLKKNSILLLNSPYDKEETLAKINEKTLNFIYNNNIKFYILNAKLILKKIQDNNKKDLIKINIPMQSAFFKIFNIIPFEKSKIMIKKYIEKNYSSKGQETLEKNYKAVEFSYKEIIFIENEFIKFFLNNINKKEYKNELFIKNPNNFNVINMINLNKGNELKVSDFLNFFDGKFPNGTSTFHDKFLVTKVPEWISENCIQCGLCSLICPHGVIRSFAFNDNEILKIKNFLLLKKIKYKLNHIKMLGIYELNFMILFNRNKCTGCKMCEKICPGKLNNKSIIFRSIKNEDKNDEFFLNFCEKFDEKSQVYKKFKKNTIKTIQFKEPLLKYSDACGGCGQTSYVKLITQLFGERLYIANATGCSSIWGGSVSQIPYFKGKHGFSPAWHNSLFENNAEFGLGFLFANDVIRIRLLDYIKKILNLDSDKKIIEICEKYVKTFELGNENFEITNELIKNLNNKIKLNINKKLYDFYNKILKEKEYLSKKSIWAIGGDGWAYDIGFAGIDHVIASGKNINILILDTEMYSNTGGQTSKATPKNVKINFSLDVKKNNKKNIFEMMKTYNNSYIARVNIYADPYQCIKSFIEAEEFEGPSLIIAYAPCIGHGFKFGVESIFTQAKMATECGHWNLIRFNPKLNPSLIIDSKISKNYEDFIKNERRFYLENSSK